MNEKQIARQLKGTRDFLPEDKILRDKIIQNLKQIFELYGYNPVETPALELYEVLSNKFTGGEEILKETYKLTDQGKRKLGLRYDLTVPFARLIAMNPEIKKPFKRYQIDRAWRDGPIKLGRYREFWQCDVDIAGTNSIIAEAELLALASDFFRSIDLNVEIEINNMGVLKNILKYSGVPESKYSESLISIDKLKKIGEKKVIQELKEKNISDRSIKKIIELISLKGSNKEILNKLKSKLNTENIQELISLNDYCEKFNLKNIKINLSLSRALSYYTGVIFEAYSKEKDCPITSSLCGGGRYDKMISDLIQSGEEIPAVGISFVLDTITDAIKLIKRLKNQEIKKSVVKVYLISIGDSKKIINQSIKLIQELRKNKINSDISFSQKISKSLDFANKNKIPYVIFLGENEVKENKLRLRDMKTGKELLINLKQVLKLLK